MVETHLVTRWTTERIAPFVDDISRLLKKYVAKWPDDVSYEGICADLNTGNWDMWVFFEKDRPAALMLCRMLETQAGKKRYEINAFAGEVRDNELEQIKHIENYARKHGALGIEARARLGMARIMRGLGYKPALETLRKRLEP